MNKEIGILFLPLLFVQSSKPRGWCEGWKRRRKYSRYCLRLYFQAPFLYRVQVAEKAPFQWLFGGISYLTGMVSGVYWRGQLNFIMSCIVRIVPNLHNFSRSYLVTFKVSKWNLEVRKLAVRYFEQFILVCNSIFILSRKNTTRSVNYTGCLIVSPGGVGATGLLSFT